jgi:hypothetical protein
MLDRDDLIPHFESWMAPLTRSRRDGCQGHLGSERRRMLRAAGSASSGRSDLSERIEEILAAEAEQFRS